MSTKTEDRYASAKDLADDVEKYLADEPVSAMRDPLFVRAKRWMRKHPATTAGSAMSMLLLLIASVIGVALVTNSNQRLESKNNELATANTRLDVARTRAEENFQAANDAVEKYLVNVTQNERLKESDFSDLRKELLESAIPFFEKLKDQKPGDEKVEASRANGFFRLASIQFQTGDLKESREN